MSTIELSILTPTVNQSTNFLKSLHQCVLANSVSLSIGKTWPEHRNKMVVEVVVVVAVTIVK